MNWDAVGAVGEIIGALAVVISLIYVAVQIRQNTSETRASRTQNLVAANSEATALIASNPEFARLSREGMLRFDELSDDEKWQFSLMFFSIFNQYDFAYHQYLEGKLDPAFFERLSEDTARYMALPGMASWWAQDKERLSKEFVEFIDKHTDLSKANSAHVATIGSTSKTNE